MNCSCSAVIATFLDLFPAAMLWRGDFVASQPALGLIGSVDEHLRLPVDAIGAAGRRAVRERVFVPVKNNRCEMVEGASPEEQAAKLAQRLREAKVI